MDTDAAGAPSETGSAGAREAIYLVGAGASVLARVRVALVGIEGYRSIFCSKILYCICDGSPGTSASSKGYL